MEPLTKQRWLEANAYGKELFVDEALAENARLQAALEEAQQRLSEKTDSWDGAFREIEALAKTFLADRDRYKALAEIGICKNPES